MYQICTKSVPDMNAFASLSVTYGVAFAACLACFLITGGRTDIAGEFAKVNWAPIVLGVVIVGLEVGWIFAYRAGWQVSTAFIIQSCVLAGGLLLVGWGLYHEAISWNKIAGVIVCLIGLVIINYK